MTPTRAEVEEALAVWQLDDPQRNDAMLEAVVDAARFALPFLDGSVKEIWWCRIYTMGWEEGVQEPCEHGYDTGCGLVSLVIPNRQTDPLGET